MDNITVELTPEEIAYIQEAIKRTRKTVGNATFALRDVDYDDLTDNQIWEITFWDQLGQIAEKLKNL
jgi:hypothetical protein